MRVASLLFALLVSAGQCFAQAPTAEQIAVARTVGTLLLLVNPNRPENKDWPPFMRERLRELFKRSADGKLVIFVRDDSEEPDDGLMRVGRRLEDGAPAIAISYARARVMAYGEAARPSRLVVNTFAVSLVHEGVHLETDLFKKEDLTKEEVVGEELRTWMKVDQLVVTPLLAQGEPLHKGLVDFNRIRAKCSGQSDCPEAGRFIEAKGY